LVPLVIIGNVPGQQIVLPTAIVILGGLVTSTLLTLFVTPLLCCASADLPRRRLKRVQTLQGVAE
jgi:Cu/Ag efflux pump CusA